MPTEQEYIDVAGFTCCMTPGARSCASAETPPVTFILHDADGLVVVSCTLAHRWATPDGIQTVRDQTGESITIVRPSHEPQELFFDRQALRETQCFDISIDTLDNLYVLESGLATHNTEKGRQLMTALGGTIGGVAGTVTYFAGQ